MGFKNMQKKSFFYFLSSYLFIYLLFLPKIGQNVKGFKLSNKYHIKIYTFKLTKMLSKYNNFDVVCLGHF